MATTTNASGQTVDGQTIVPGSNASGTAVVPTASSSPTPTTSLLADGLPHIVLPSANVNASSPIDASSLSGDTSSPQIINPQYPSLYPTSTLGSSGVPSLQETDLQKSADALTGSLSDLQTQEAGKAADTSALYAKAGLTYSTDANGNPVVNDPTISDLTAKLTDLQNQALAIPDQLQLNATGRGETVAGLQPQQTAALRNNSIQALGVSSLIAAKQGQLAYASQLIDNQIQQKYGPIEAEIKAAQANLQNIINSPAYSVEEKNQAQDQQDALNQRAAQLDLAKTNYTDTQTEVLKYAGVADAQTLSEMQQASTPAEVAQIAAEAGIVQPQSGRYQQTTSTLTDAFGNQYQVQHIFDTLTGKYITPQNGQTAAQLNSNDPNGGSTGPFSAPTTTPSNIASGGKGQLDFTQYGLLSNTNFNPGNTVDALAQRYLDAYVKTGTVPTSSVLGRNIKPGAMAAIDSRARDLYHQATGTALPNPEIIKGYQSLVNTNNTFLNTLQTQEGTIQANFGLNLQNLTNNDINATGPTSLNNFVDSLKNWAGDPQVAQYMLQNATIANEFGSILALRNAQGTTVHDKLESAGLLPSGASVGQQKQLLSTLLQEAQNAKSSIQSVNADLYKQIDPLMQDPNNPGIQQHQNSQFVEQALTSQGLHYDALMQEMQGQAPAGTQPALDAKTGKPGFATPAEIQAGTAIPL